MLDQKDAIRLESQEIYKKGANIALMLQSMGNHKDFKVSYFCQLIGAILLSAI
jgi:hypothetical protein